MDKEEKEIPPVPIKTCYNCKGLEYYLPGDYFLGKPIWLCTRCRKAPKGSKIKATYTIGDKDIDYKV